MTSGDVCVWVVCVSGVSECWCGKCVSGVVLVVLLCGVVVG